MLRLALPCAAKGGLAKRSASWFVFEPDRQPDSEPTLLARFTIKTIRAVLWLMRGLCMVCARQNHGRGCLGGDGEGNSNRKSSAASRRASNDLYMLLHWLELYIGSQF